MEFKVLKQLSGSKCDCFVEKYARVFVANSNKFIAKKEKYALCDHLAENIIETGWISNPYDLDYDFLPQGSYFPEKRKIELDNIRDSVKSKSVAIHEVGHALAYSNNQNVSPFLEKYDEAINSVAEMMVAISHFPNAKIIIEEDKKENKFPFQPSPYSICYDFNYKLQTEDELQKTHKYSWYVSGLFRVLKSLDVSLIDAIRSNTFVADKNSQAYKKLREFCLLPTDEEKLKILSPLSLQDCQKYVDEINN